MGMKFAREPDLSSIRAALEWVNEQGALFAADQGKPEHYGREVALITLGVALANEGREALYSAICISIMHPPATVEGLDALQLALEEEV